MTDQTTSAGHAESEDDILDYVHGQRKRILDHVMGQKVPDDPKMIGIALQTLDGMSRDALGKKRIKVDEKTNATAEAASGIIAQLLRQASGGTPFQTDKPVHRPDVVLPADVPPPSLVEGETATVAPQGSFDDFTNSSKKSVS